MASNQKNQSEPKILLGFSDYRSPAIRLARALSIPYREIRVHRFPDGETKVTLPPELPAWTIVCRTLSHPNEKLLELILSAATARRLGARRVTLVAPYLCYMRQDRAFHPGESVSMQVIGDLLAGSFDDLVTVDPHLHRVHTLESAVPVNRAISLSATKPMAELVLRELPGGMLIGPDEESSQWVAKVANAAGCGYAIARKRREGDREVSVDLPPGEFQGRDLLLLDDMASTGRTLDALIEQLWYHHPASISAMVTHALFFGDAYSRLRRAGVLRIWSTDSVLHESNTIQLDTMLAGGIRILSGSGSVEKSCVRPVESL